MERTLNLRLHSNGQWSAIDDNGGDKLAFELENNATSIVIQLPDATSGYTHYLEIELPDGTVLLSSAITEELRDSIRCLVIPVGYPITAQFGRVRIQYVGRKDESKQIRSSLLALDVDESIDSQVVSLSNPDFITWTEAQIDDLKTRVVALENGESAEVHADSDLVGGQIIIADGTGKKIKSSGKSVDDVLTEAAAASLIQVNGEKERAQGVEGNHEARITALEHDTYAHVDSDSDFVADEIVTGVGSGKLVKSSGETIQGLKNTAATYANNAKVEAKNDAHADAVNLVNTEKERAQGVESGLTTRVGALEGTVGDANSGLVKRVTDLENGEAGEVHADNNFTDGQILIADGSGKKVKSSGKTPAGILEEAHTDAVAQANAEKERAQEVEGGLNTRVTALENAGGDNVIIDEDNNKTYSYQLKIVNGKPCVYYEEIN